MSVEPRLLQSSDVLLEDIEQHFKVIAGPGAGKTHWLCNHIKNVLNKSNRLNKCRKIACITYTNVGVETIVKKLDDSIDGVEVNTIHSFLYKHIVKPYIFLIKDEYGFDPSKIDGHDELVPSAGIIYSWKKETRQTYLQDDNTVIKDLCNLCWKFTDDGEELELKFRKQRLGNCGNYSIKGDSLIKYKNIFWLRNQLHHDDILYFSYILLKKHPMILRILRDKFPYYFIDEFQDTNPIQTRIIQILAEKESVIGVIGDKAQSIYEFQGADVKQFEKFTLKDMVLYKIENNHRSTLEIINILNTVRIDIEQHNPANKRNHKPFILVGETLSSLKRAGELAGSDDIYTLSYANTTSCEMKNQHIGRKNENLLMKLQDIDSNRIRNKLIIAVIKGVEYARQNLFKDAIKEVARCCKETDAFKGKKTALSLIHKMMVNYENYVNGSLYDFYSKLNTILDGIIKIAVIRTSRSSAIKTFYEGTTYKDFILWLKYNDDTSYHRTIHKAKGDEFDNVFVIVKDKNNDNGTREFDQEKSLEFLLNPKLEEVDHRVYYVALSRAKERLFINVPALSKGNKDKLEVLGFDIEYIGN